MKKLLLMVMIVASLIISGCSDTKYTHVTGSKETTTPSVDTKNTNVIESQGETSSNTNSGYVDIVFKNDKVVKNASLNFVRWGEGFGPSFPYNFKFTDDLNTIKNEIEIPSNISRKFDLSVVKRIDFKDLNESDLQTLNYTTSWIYHFNAEDVRKVRVTLLDGQIYENIYILEIGVYKTPVEKGTIQDPTIKTIVFRQETTTPSVETKDTNVIGSQGVTSFNNSGYVDVVFKNDNIAKNATLNFVRWGGSFGPDSTYDFKFTDDLDAIKNEEEIPNDVSREFNLSVVKRIDFIDLNESDLQTLNDMTSWIYSFNAEDVRKVRVTLLDGQIYENIYILEIGVYKSPIEEGTIQDSTIKAIKFKQETASPSYYKETAVRGALIKINSSLPIQVYIPGEGKPEIVPDQAWTCGFRDEGDSISYDFLINAEKFSDLNISATFPGGKEIYARNFKVENRADQKLGITAEHQGFSYVMIVPKHTGLDRIYIGEPVHDWDNETVVIDADMVGADGFELILSGEQSKGT